MFARARTAQCRWSTRSVRPLWALAKTPCADGAARSFFLCLRSCKHGAGLGCLSGGARGACAPVRHSQKRLAPMALLDLFSYACARASTARDGALARWSTQGVRPLWALAKTPCADGAARSFFLCLRSCKHGAGIRKTPALLRSEAFLLVGAGGRTRTDTDFTPQDFESSASASFTTPALHHTGADNTISQHRRVDKCFALVCSRAVTMHISRGLNGAFTG